MRPLATTLCLALAGCTAATEGDYPRILPLVPILTEAEAEAEAPAEAGDAALEARAAALRAQAAALRQAEF